MRPSAVRPSPFGTTSRAWSLSSPDRCSACLEAMPSSASLSAAWWAARNGPLQVCSCLHAAQLLQTRPLVLGIPLHQTRCSVLAAAGKRLCLRPFEHLAGCNMLTLRAPPSGPHQRLGTRCASEG